MRKHPEMLDERRKDHYTGATFRLNAVCGAAEHRTENERAPLASY
ncbi:hypothetical protein [uncultured Cohaesibacter sp.]|nr:hypothetical protein [uncultured Cohaesibacter sp.]